MRPWLLVCLLAACSPVHGEDQPRDASAGVAPAATEGERGVALFAGGCFWCVESAFDDLPGVVAAVSGYAGGASSAPTYKEVSSGGTGHAEVVRVVFDPAKVDYPRLLEVFWHNIDPLQDDGQFCDRGTQYRSEIFALSKEQRAQAQQSAIAVAERLGKPVVTRISDGATFWPAEEYHQDFHEKNPTRYLSYRTGCGRDRRLKELWGADAGH